MFSIDQNSFPSKQDLESLLVKTHFANEIPDDAFSCETHKACVIEAVNDVKRDLLKSVNRMDVVDSSKTKIETCLPRVIKKQQLIDRNLVIEEHDKLHASPVGLLALAMLSRDLINDQMEP